MMEVGKFFINVLLIMVAIFIIRWVSIRYDIPGLKQLSEGV